MNDESVTSSLQSILLPTPLIDAISCPREPFAQSLLQ